MAAKKFQKFWKRVWGTKAWADEVNELVRVAELAQLREFLAAYNQPTSGNTSQLRKRVRDYVAAEVEARAQRSRDAAAKRNQANREKDEAEVEITVEPEEAKSATLGQLAELGRDFQGRITALRDQIDELRKQLENLRKQASEYVTRSELTDVKQEVANSASKGDLISAKADMRESFLRDVQEAIEATLEGRDKKKFLEWWDKVNEFMNKRPLEPEEGA